jgi:molybdate transport system substrate-binding protein
VNPVGVLLVVATTLATATACGGGTGAADQQQITVLAASSLTDAFTAEAAAYKRVHPRASVTLSFAGSQALVAQVRQGVPADVLATADATSMASVGAHLVGGSRRFARNRLVIVVGKGNPKHVVDLAALANPRLVVVLAAPSVPAGRYAAQALAATGVVVHAKSLEDNVRGVLTKVEFGEADAGIVYATDARAARGKVDALPVAGSPLATYPIAALTRAGRAFVDFVLSPAGQQVLGRYGFLPP